MSPRHHIRLAPRWFAGALGLAVLSYGAFAGFTWTRYGRATRPASDEEDLLLDQFMPAYEAAERHHIEIAAPPEITLAAAKDQDLFRAPLVRAIFKVRGLVLGASPNQQRVPGGLLGEVLSLGWGVLAEVPGREIVVGTVTKPWEPDVTFRTLAAVDFVAFSEPGYVKIAWTLRADPAGTGSIFRTETRVMTTDHESRVRFRRYWSMVLPGVILIRRLLLAPLKREAERRARACAAEINGRPTPSAVARSSQCAYRLTSSEPMSR